MSHATCEAHFLRELNAIEEMEPDHEWVGRFRELLLKMKESRGLVLSIGADRVDHIDRICPAFEHTVIVGNKIISARDVLYGG